MTTRLEALAAAERRLAKAGVGTAAGDARRLLSHVTGLSSARLMLEGDEPLAAELLTAFEATLEARSRFQPVAQIIGRRAFWKHDFLVTPDVLDPRPETEQLVETALQETAPTRFLDMGTGSGAIVISLLREWPNATALATDVSAQALEVARKNAAALGVVDRLTLKLSHWFEQVDERFDLIVSNPPYISNAEMQELAPDVRNWEPHLALTPGGDGLDPYREIATGLAAHLRPGGHAIFETGIAQVETVMMLFAGAGFSTLRSYNDLTGRKRGVFIEF